MLQSDETEQYPMVQKKLFKTYKDSLETSKNNKRTWRIPICFLPAEVKISSS